LQDVTAWVGASDYVALAALDFLKTKGKTVPGDISVMGFDDSFEALYAELSSYNFNIRSYASSMLDFACTGRHLFTGAVNENTGQVELPGRIIERKSTKKMYSPDGLFYER
jgi:DNA-binding LacI/PurR family transcriptional regulator